MLILRKNHQIPGLKCKNEPFIYVLSKEKGDALLGILFVYIRSDEVFYVALLAVYGIQPVKHISIIDLVQFQLYLYRVRLVVLLLNLGRRYPVRESPFRCRL